MSRDRGSVDRLSGTDLRVGAPEPRDATRASARSRPARSPPAPLPAARPHRGTRSAPAYRAGRDAISIRRAGPRHQCAPLDLRRDGVEPRGRRHHVGGASLAEPGRDLVRGVCPGGDRTEPSPALARRRRRSCSRRRRREGPPPELPTSASTSSRVQSRRPISTPPRYRLRPGPPHRSRAVTDSQRSRVVVRCRGRVPYAEMLARRSLVRALARSRARRTRAGPPSDPCGGPVGPARPRLGSRAPCPTINCCASGAGGAPTGEPSSASCRRSRTSSAPGCPTSGRGTTSRRCRCSGTAPASYGHRARSAVP